MLTSKNFMIAVLLVAAGNISAMDQEEYRVELGGGEIALTPAEEAQAKEVAKRKRAEDDERRDRLKPYMNRETIHNITTSDVAWQAHEIATNLRFQEFARDAAQRARALALAEAGGRPLNLPPVELFPDSDDSDSDN